MSDIQHPYTIMQATHPSQSLTLPCGHTVSLCRLRMGDRDACFEQYACLLQALSISLDRDPTRAEVLEMIPDVLIDAYCAQISLEGEGMARVGQQRVLQFFQFFAPELCVEQVEQFEHDDFTAMWEALWQLCRLPFELGFTVMSNGRFQQARELWRSTKQNSSPPCSE